MEYRPSSPPIRERPASGSMAIESPWTGSANPAQLDLALPCSRLSSILTTEPRCPASPSRHAWRSVLLPSHPSSVAASKRRHVPSFAFGQRIVFLHGGKDFRPHRPGLAAGSIREIPADIGPTGVFHAVGTVRIDPDHRTTEEQRDRQQERCGARRAQEGCKRIALMGHGFLLAYKIKDSQGSRLDWRRSRLARILPDAPGAPDGQGAQPGVRPRPCQAQACSRFVHGLRTQTADMSIDRPHALDTRGTHSHPSMPLRWPARQRTARFFAIVWNLWRFVPAEGESE